MVREEKVEGGDRGDLVETKESPNRESPKENSPHSYLLLKDGTFYWKTLGGEVYRTAPLFG